MNGRAVYPHTQHPISISLPVRADHECGIARDAGISLASCGQDDLLRLHYSPFGLGLAAVWQSCCFDARAQWMCGATVSFTSTAILTEFAPLAPFSPLALSVRLLSPVPLCNSLICSPGTPPTVPASRRGPPPSRRKVLEFAFAKRLRRQGLSMRTGIHLRCCDSCDDGASGGGGGELGL